MDVQASQTPYLQWVLVNGKLCEVSEFSGLAPKDRPEAHCPVCERVVTLKLGQKRVHHFAHRPEDICSATNSESAIHLNCKFHIYRQLQRARKLSTNISCNACHRQQSIVWKSNWDDVRVEYRLDSTRPDVALLKNGKVIGAIEVFVTHAVDEVKAALLNDQGIDWIEVQGYEDFYETTGGWTVTQPLAAVRQHPAAQAWTCYQCQEKQQQEEYKKNHPIIIRRARLIDFYYRSGKKYRNVFYVKYVLAYGEITCMRIEGSGFKLIVEEHPPFTEASEDQLYEAFEKELLVRKQKATVVDDGMGWTAWEHGQKFYIWDEERFPFRYVWHEKKREWVLQPKLKWNRLR